MAKSTVAVKFTGDVAALKKATGEAEGTLSGFGKKAAGILKTGMLAAGGLAAAALAKGFADSLEQEKSIDKAAASLGLSPEESAELGKISGALYADAYGESFGEVADAVASVKASIGSLDENADIEGLTANALDFATAFDSDVNEAVSAAGLLLSNGLVKDGEEAFDLLTKASQELPPAIRDEVLAATGEYSTFFADLGISGQAAFATIIEAAEKGGTFGVDKVGDALKELTIRSTDMSASSIAAYEAAGLSAEEMAGQFVQGGDAARGALIELVDGLMGIKDPVKQAGAAIGLFGTPLEDLGVSEIPDFLDSLSMVGEGMADVEGAADRMGDTLNDNLATKIEGFKRKGLQKLSDFVGGTVIPAVEKLGKVFNERIRPALEDLAKQFQEKAVPALQEFWASIQDDVKPTIEQLAKTWEEDLQPALKETMDFLVETALPILAEVVGFVLRNIIPAVIKWWGEFESMKAKVLPIIVAVGQFIGALAVKIAEFVVAAKAKWDDFVAKARDVRDKIQSAFGSVVDFFKGMPSKISGAVSGMWDGIQTAFVKVLNFIIDKWNALDFSVAGKSIGLPDIKRIGTPTKSAFLPGSRIPRMATGGVAASPMLAMIGDAGAGDPEVVSPVSLMRKIMREEAGGLTQVINLVVDGKVLAQVVNDQNQSRGRRNGR